MSGSDRPGVPLRSELIDALRRTVDLIESDLRFHFHHLHRHPEPSWEEHATSEYVEECLASLGFEPQRMAGTGVIVDIAGDTALPRRALRADLDAIYVREATGLSYASTREGVMHACGHDAHTSILLGVAKVLRLLELEGIREEYRPLRLVFQPAEETLPSGSQRMIDAGVLTGVSDVVGLHVWPPLATGEIGLREGAMTAACDGFAVQLRGPGGHGARPRETADLIRIAASIVERACGIPAERLDPARHPPAVLSFGMVRGGESLNVIPSELIMKGSIRTLDEPSRAILHTALAEICRAAADAGGAECELTIDRGPPAVLNDPGLVGIGRSAVSALLGESAVVTLERASMGSEDFGHFLEHVPGVLLRLGTTAPGSVMHPLHSSRFQVDDAALRYGVLTLAAFAFA